MKAPITRALAADALYQVLDNWVFRILAVLTLVPILFTFVLGFREEGIVLLFGLKTWSYASLFEAFSGSTTTIPDSRGLLIEVVLRVVFDFLAGSLGMLFSIVATAFFVPRMLEKGAADVLFHKPVSRWTLYLSRYFAGLLFIALVAFLLVAGMYLGLLLVSGHHDPAILFASLELTYVFALIHAVSMLVGVITRSTVAAILLTSLFFFFNGCVHHSWIAQQMFASGEVPALQRPSPAEDGGSEQSAEPGAGEVEEGEGEGKKEPSTSRLRECLLATLEVAHLVLPKTTDASYLSRKLRSSMDPPFHQEEDSRLTLFRLPDGMHDAEPGQAAALPLSDGLRGRLGEPRFLLRGSEREPEAFSISLWRRPVERSESRIGSRTRVRRETASQAANAFRDVLEEEAGVRELQKESLSFGASTQESSDLDATLLRWQTGAGTSGRSRRAIVCKASEAIYTLLIDVPGEPGEERMTELQQRVEANMGIASGQDWYEREFRLDAPVRMNILFSIGSSLAFTLAVLALGWWRLRRIDF